MLGKLFKSEFQQTYKPIVLMYLITTGLTFLACITNSFSNSNELTNLGKIIDTIINISYVLSLAAVIFVCFIISCYNFYKSMYSERGYLTHTIPVNPTTTFTVKFIVALIWVSLAAFLMLGCIAALLCTNLQVSPIAIWTVISKEWKSMDASIELSDFIFFGKTFGGSLVKFLFMIVIGVIHALLFIFTSLTVGQLSNNHKIGCSVAAGVGLYFVGQIFGSILVVSKVFPMVTKQFGEHDIINNVNSLFIIVFIFLLIFMIAEYLLNMIIVKKHINLQ